MTKVSELFAVEYGNKFDMNKMRPATKDTGIAFVGRRGGLTGVSGVSGYVRPVGGVDPNPSGTLTVALGGSRLLSSYVQQRPYYTGQNVAVLTPVDSNMSLKQRLFFALCIKHNDFRYTAFGREANRTLGEIDLPSEIPSWVDASHIPTHEGLAQSLGCAVPLVPPTTPLWQSFELQELFEVKKGRRVPKADRVLGTTRFVGASEKNNGITDHSDLQATFGPNTITVVYNGNSVGFAFLQEQDYFASDDVNVLVPKSKVSRWALLFVCTLIRHTRGRFTYGYKWTLGRMKTTKIALPTTKDGYPDWLYMEQFMRGLPFSAAI